TFENRLARAQDGEREVVRLWATWTLQSYFRRQEKPYGSRRAGRLLERAGLQQRPSLQILEERLSYNTQAYYTDGIEFWAQDFHISVASRFIKAIFEVTK